MARGLESGLLSASVEVATYGSRAVGFVDRVSNAPYLDVLATATPAMADPYGGWRHRDRGGDRAGWISLNPWDISRRRR